MCRAPAAPFPPPAPERAIGFLLGGRDGRLLLAAVLAIAGWPLVALAAIVVTSALSLTVRLFFLRRSSLALTR